MILSNLTFNNKNSYSDFNITIEKVSIQSPSKKKIKDSVPYRNGSYDFSTVGSNGEIIYNERELKINFNLKCKNKLELYSKYTSTLEWLLGSPKSKLTFNFIPGYYFLGEVENSPTFEEVLQRAGRLEVIFVCDPFKYGTELAGELLWDNIDFNLPDYIQETNFDAVGNKTVTLYVSGSHSIVPKVVTNSSMSCTLNNYTAVFDSNKNTDYQFKLLPGENVITINGTGNIDFQFRKKVL